MNWNIVLVWAWWTGMSGIAGILSDLWFNNLICIDWTESQLTNNLKDKWITMIIWHGKYIPTKEDIVIYSEATVNSVEVQTAKARPNDTKRANFTMNYFQFLGEISKYFISCWIAGTNGKSTTTAMALFLAKKHLPNFGLGILWALVPDLNWQSYAINQNIKSDLKNIFDSIFTTKTPLNYEILKKYVFIVEACEYKRHFLNLDLDYTVITNIKLDHTDYYKNEDDYFSAFDSLIAKIKQKVIVPENLHSKGLKDYENNPKIEKIQIEHIDFKYIFGEQNIIDWNFACNILNKLSPTTYRSIVLKPIVLFKGLWRRMEMIWKNGNWAMIYSDYWHIAESIWLWFDALKNKYPDKKLFCIFQPHQISRIALWREEFKKTLPQYDEVVIYDIYAARESLDIVKQIWINWVETLKDLWDTFAKECNWTYIESFDVLKQKIEDKNSDYVVIYFSAGDLDFKVRAIFWR